MLLQAVLCAFTPIFSLPHRSFQPAHATSTAASQWHQSQAALHEAALSTSLQGINSLVKQTQPVEQEQTASPSTFPDLRPGHQPCKDQQGWRAQPPHAACTLERVSWCSEGRGKPCGAPETSPQPRVTEGSVRFGRVEAERAPGELPSETGERQGLSTAPLG